MASVTYFEENLQGSDWGKPTDRRTTGFKVRILEFNGFVHIEMTPAAGEEAQRYMALFTLKEAKQFIEAMSDAVRRVEPLG
jgi:hypothetical protein